MQNGSNQEAKLINKSNYQNTLKSILFFSGGIIVFITGVIGYGVILNLRAVALSEIMSEKGLKTLSKPIIVVDRSSYTLSLYDDSVFIKSYRASFGPNLREKKKRAGDLATPVGDYEICDIDTSYLYDKFLRLNYPNLNDITEGLRKGLITQSEFDRLKYQFYYEGCPSLETALGGNIGIQGTGRLNFLLQNLPFVYNWTNGSIAISNEGIDELYSVVKKGTKIVIK